MINVSDGVGPTHKEVIEFVLKTVFYNHLFTADDEFIEKATRDVAEALYILIPGWSIEVILDATSYSVDADVTLWLTDASDAFNISASLTWG